MDFKNKLDLWYTVDKIDLLIFKQSRSIIENIGLAIVVSFLFLIEPFNKLILPLKVLPGVLIIGGFFVREKITIDKFYKNLLKAFDDWLDNKALTNIEVDAGVLYLDEEIKDIKKLSKKSSLSRKNTRYYIELMSKVEDIRHRNITLATNVSRERTSGPSNVKEVDKAELYTYLCSERENKKDSNIEKQLKTRLKEFLDDEKYSLEEIINIYISDYDDVKDVIEKHPVYKYIEEDIKFYKSIA